MNLGCPVPGNGSSANDKTPGGGAEERRESHALLAWRVSGREIKDNVRRNKKK